MAVRAQRPDLVARFADPVGRTIARSGVSPNTLTTLGLLLTAGAALAVASGRPMLAGGLLLAGGLMDLLDGAVARASGRSTPFGGFYDSVSDRMSDGMILAGIAWYVAGTPRLLLLALSSLVLAEVTSYVRARAETIDVPCEVGIVERGERAVLVIVGLLVAPLLEPVLWALALGGLVTVVQRVHHVWCQIDRDLPEELLALAHADRAWSRAFVRTARAFYGARNFDEAFGGDLDSVLGEGRTERLRERLAHRLRTGSEEAREAVARRVRRGAGPERRPGERPEERAEERG